MERDPQEHSSEGEEIQQDEHKYLLYKILNVERDAEQSEIVGLFYLSAKAVQAAHAQVPP